MVPISDIPQAQDVLIAGPTASGKSGLALEIAERRGGVIVNADALQVYSNWRVLTARPSLADEARASHHLYGHVPPDVSYSVGAWLRDVADVRASGERLIIVGGTGLYFRALTEGLAEIPEIPPAIRAEGNQLREADFTQMLEALDAPSRSLIDQSNPMRVQRAWEVLTATGRGLQAWHDATPPPLMPLDTVTALVLEAPKDWLTPRIALRFEQMIELGALEEARQNQPMFDPDAPAHKAIGAPELMAYLREDLTLEQAKEAATIATQQYAKRQRTWFRARMGNWTPISAADL
ncbi:tRNA (adenosine(37)-N6)-dimethylallyltransferase MiaA [Algirhabdus cladophorae]|uniref:tRNA (adenosine(37)-N6)-dimethylallyltransferase MiaA n=1 Tax=Algirhabdus cladophorae TaxID=3377108 RepID=UPI003B848589